MQHQQFHMDLQDYHLQHVQSHKKLTTLRIQLLFSNESEKHELFHRVHKSVSNTIQNNLDSQNPTNPSYIF